MAATDVLGRTNQAFPRIWLSLATPHDPSREGWAREIVEAAQSAGTVLDISSNPALWGGLMRGTNAPLMVRSGFDYERATDETHATDLVQAHLIQTLSSIGREYIDFYFLAVRRMVEEFQINGALAALEAAKQDGHVRHIGVSCEGPSLAVLGLWQFHDAFEVLLVPRNHRDAEDYETLVGMARERRVGVVTSRPLEWGYGVAFTELPSQWKLRNLTQSFYGLTLAQAAIADLAEDDTVVATVHSAEEVRAFVEAPEKERPEGLSAMLEPFLIAFDSDEEWRMLAQSDQEHLRNAAERRTRDLQRV